MIIDLVKYLLEEFSDIEIGEDTFITYFYQGSENYFPFSKRISYSKFIILNIEFFDSNMFFSDSSLHIDSDGFLNIEIFISKGEKTEIDDEIKKVFLVEIAKSLVCFCKGEYLEDGPDRLINSDLFCDYLCYASFLISIFFKIPPQIFLSKYIKRYFFEEEVEEYYYLLDGVFSRMKKAESEMFIAEI